jgi:hypothetical protein
MYLALAKHVETESNDNAIEEQEFPRRPVLSNPKKIVRATQTLFGKLADERRQWHARC